MNYNTLTVDNVNLFNTYGVYISGNGTYKSAARVFTLYSIPYNNGLLLGPENHLENVDITYRCGIVRNFETNIAGLRDFLLSLNGYVEISDTYHTDEYRKGLYQGPFEPDVQAKLDGAEFDLTFNCMPQRFLNSGKTAITINTTQVTLSNPTKQNAKPLIKITGNSGNVSIWKTSTAGWSITVSSTLSTSTYPNFYVDCETMEAYSAANPSVKLNQYITINEYGTSNFAVDYPVLLSPSCYAKRTGNITAAQITPRWWRA